MPGSDCEVVVKTPTYFRYIQLYIPYNYMPLRKYIKKMLSSPKLPKQHQPFYTLHCVHTNANHHNNLIQQLHSI